MYLPPLTSICSILRPLSPACGNQSCLRRPSALRNFSKYRLCTRPELRIPNAAAQTRIVSKARIRLDSCKSVRSFKGIICVDISEFESFSIGAGLCQALSDCSVDLMWEVTRRVLASLRDRHLGPPMMGSGGCGGPIYKGVLAVRLTAGIRTRNGLASSIVPAGTSLHRSAEFTFSPVVFLLCTTRCEIHERHKCALTARALLFARLR